MGKPLSEATVQFVEAVDVEGLCIARGYSSIITPVHKFGRQPNNDTAGDDIWDESGTWAAPTQARLHYVYSSERSDSASGAGARTVQVYGLDANYLETNEIVTLDATATVTTSFSYTMIHRMVVRSAGDSENNVGKIKATAKTDGTTTAAISIGNNQTLAAVYQIPANKTGYLKSFGGSIGKAGGSGKYADFRLLLKPFGEVFQVKRHWAVGTNGTSMGDFKYVTPLEVSAKSILKIDSVPSADSSDVSGWFELVLITQGKNG